MALTLISYTLTLASIAPWLFGSAVSSPVRILQTPANILQTSGLTMKCPGPLPEAPYPTGTAMVAYRDRKGSINVLSFFDQWQSLEYIWDREELCTRAGCDCSVPVTTCNNVQHFYFDQRISSFYSAQCIRTCRCVKEQVPDVDGVLRLGNATSNDTNPRHDAL